MNHSKSGDWLFSSSWRVRFGWKSFFERDRWSGHAHQSNGGAEYSGGRPPPQYDQSSFQLHSQIKVVYRRRASLSRRAPRRPTPSSDCESGDGGLPPTVCAARGRKKLPRANMRDLDFHPRRWTALQIGLARRDEPPGQSRATRERIDRRRNASRASISTGIPSMTICPLQCFP